MTATVMAEYLRGYQARHCACGEEIKVTTYPPHTATEMAAAFDERHSGAGHAPVSAEEAVRARRRMLEEEPNR